MSRAWPCPRSGESAKTVRMGVMVGSGCFSKSFPITPPACIEPRHEIRPLRLAYRPVDRRFVGAGVPTRRLVAADAARFRRPVRVDRPRADPQTGFSHWLVVRARP